MKFRKLPPLHVLHTFELAAANLSFKLTAEQLALTPSAVSHQMLALEEFLGAPLFLRQNRRLALTDAGKAYRKSVAGALDMLREASAALRSSGQKAQLRLSVAPFIGIELLLPALAQLRQDHPELELEMLAENRQRDVLREDIDLVVRLGDGNFANLHAEQLLALTAMPVAAPRLLLQHDNPVETLLQAPLLGMTNLREAWNAWFRWSNLGNDAPRGVLWFDNYASLISAAEHGAGVAMGMWPLLRPLIEHERLVTLWPAQMPMAFSYYVLCRPERAQQPEIRAVIDWLQATLQQLN
ncbi:MAG: LysR substrate-binding domain-containing protein [Chitinivorax sp.]